MCSGCKINSQTGTNGVARGFYVNRGSCITFTDCIVKNTQGSLSDDGIGFLIEDSINSTLVRCISNKNQTSGFATISPVTTVEFKDCQAFYNGVHGFDLTGTDSTVRLFRNIASDNGLCY